MKVLLLLFFVSRKISRQDRKRGGPGRKTHTEEIEMGNQMTAKRFQTGAGHQKSLTSLNGGGGPGEGGLSITAFSYRFSDGRGDLGIALKIAESEG